MSFQLGKAFRGLEIERWIDTDMEKFDPPLRPKSGGWMGKLTHLLFSAQP